MATEEWAVYGLKPLTEYKTGDLLYLSFKDKIGWIRLFSIECGWNDVKYRVVIDGRGKISADWTTSAMYGFAMRFDAVTGAEFEAVEELLSHPTVICPVCKKELIWIFPEKLTQEDILRFHFSYQGDDALPQ